MPTYSLNLLIDVNLSPRWVPVLQQNGVDAVHWREVGDLDARDETIMKWARAHTHVVFTHDLDFTTILAVTQADGPSVLQIRSGSVLPSSMETAVVEALDRFGDKLAEGAVVSVDLRRARAQVLPLQ